MLDTRQKNLSLLKVAFATLCAWGAGTAHAEVFSVEGAVRSITALVGGEYRVVCGNHTVFVNASTRITSPVGTLTLAQLASTEPFPDAGFNSMTGAPRVGFVGAMCVADGNDTTRPGSYLATDLYVEVSENVAVGTVTGANPLSVNGVVIQPLVDSRISAYKPATGYWNANGTHPAGTGPFLTPSLNVEVARNELGFGVDLQQVTVGALGSFDGYYAGNGIDFYAYNLEVNTNALLRIDPRPSITRAECRNRNTANRDELDVRGGCVIRPGANNTAVQLHGQTSTGALQAMGTVTCTAAPLDGLPPPVGFQFGSYRFSSSNLNFAGNVCPDRLRATTVQNGVTRYDWSDFRAVR